MGNKLFTIETYKGVAIELWFIPNTGYLYHALIGKTHNFFDRYKDARIRITNGGKE